MKHRLFAPLLAATALLSLSGCLTPDRCQRALTGLTAASEIVTRLQALGYQSDVAAKIAQALAVGQITLATACASAGSPSRI